MKLKELKLSQPSALPTLSSVLGKTLKKFALAGAGLGLVFGLIYFAPASWVGFYFERLSNGKLTMVQTSGTVWNGQGQLLYRSHIHPSLEQLSSVQPELLVPSPFVWHISLEFTPFAVVRASVENTCCLKTPLELRISPQSRNSSGLIVQISDSESTWPAQWLSGLGAPWNTVAPKGSLIVQTGGVQAILHPFSEEEPRLEGVAQITLQDLSSQLSTLDPLGTYVIKLWEPGDGVTLHLSLETLEGRLMLTGEGEWINQRLHFNGLAKAQSGFEAALANLLSVLGPRHDNTATLKIG